MASLDAVNEKLKHVYDRATPTPEEVLLWSKAGTGVAKDFAETGMTEFGRCSGLNDKRAMMETRIAFVELTKKTSKK